MIPPSLTRYELILNRFMLRKIRIALAALFLLCMTLLFLDFSGVAGTWFSWMARLQFIPAVLSLNIGVLVLLVLMTLVCGRIYCSVICPLGVFQDVVNSLSSHGKKKKFRFQFGKPLSLLRYSVLVLFAGCLVMGVSYVVTILDPYSTFGLFTQSLFGPVYEYANNGLAFLSERAESYAFYEVDVFVKALPVLLVAATLFVAVILFSVFGGRLYCNSICPVGTFLGLLSRFAWFRPQIDTAKCNGCGLCEKQCKSTCISSKDHKIDYSRCVACMDCLEACRKNAITFSHVSSKKEASKVDSSRRGFVATLGAIVAAGVAKAEEKANDGGLAPIIDKVAPKRVTKIVPPGARSIRNLERSCTGCQLCVTACKNDVLRPSTDLSSFLQPYSSYERGYCRPECTACSDVCPAGAILKITPEEKSSIQIGHAVWVRENCLPVADGTSCGNCARHCPTGAIQMINLNSDDESSPRIPMIDTERCIGCGACENLCPARPLSAIYVEGHENHRTI